MKTTVQEIQAKSILRKSSKIDSWFITYYGMNLYRGCAHNCIYCDGRSEKYNVDGDFGMNIAVKTNAVEVLLRELDPARKRAPLKKCFICLGGGVGDSYQPFEEKYKLARKTLKLLHELHYPVHILTKSSLVRRDLDIIKAINVQTRALLSMSFSTVDEKIASIFEPNVPSPEKRLETLAYFKEQGIACGLFYMPVIPLISDTPEQMERVMARAAELNLDYVIFGGMTLKPGRQMEYFLQVLREHYPEQAQAYDKIYPGLKWGSADPAYAHRINTLFYRLAKKYGLAPRIPVRLFNSILKENDLAVVILEHMDYILKLQQRTSPYGYAAYSISSLKETLAEVNDKKALKSIRGVGSFTEKIIQEILATKNCKYLDSLLNL
jgi:DNA repair photolyase